MPSVAFLYFSQVNCAPSDVLKYTSTVSSVTVIAAVAVLPLLPVAVMMAVPADTPRTVPSGSTVATLGVLEDQVTVVSVGFAVAVSLTVSFTLMLAVDGLTVNVFWVEAPVTLNFTEAHFEVSEVEHAVMVT